MNEIPKLFITGDCGRSVYMSVADFHKSGDTMVQSDSMMFELGGSGLIRAVTAKRLGAVTHLYSLLPESSRNVASFAEKEGITLSASKFPDIKPFFKTALVDKYNDVRETVYSDRLYKIDRYAILGAEETIRYCNGLILDKLISDDALYMALEIAKRGGAKTVFLPSENFSLDSEVLSKIYINIFEAKTACTLLGTSGSVQSSDIAFALMRKGIKRAVVLNGHNVMLFENDEVTTLKMAPSPKIIAAGVLDVFTAALTVYLCRGYNTAIALKYAVSAVGVANEKDGIIDALPYKEQIKLR